MIENTIKFRHDDGPTEEDLLILEDYILRIPGIGRKRARQLAIYMTDNARSFDVLLEPFRDPNGDALEVRVSISLGPDGRWEAHGSSSMNGKVVAVEYEDGTKAQMRTLIGYLMPWKPEPEKPRVYAREIIDKSLLGKEAP